MEKAENKTTKPLETRDNPIDKVTDSHSVRRSLRNQKQRMNIDQEDIGECDDENDPDYK